VNEYSGGCSIALLLLAALGAAVFLLVTSAGIHQGTGTMQAMETGSSAGCGIILIAAAGIGLLLAICWNAANSGGD